MPAIVDSHCHLNFPDFAPEMDAVVERAREAGLVRMVTISTRVHEFDKILAITDAYDDVYCSVGTHPHNADEELDVMTKDLVAHANHPKVVAIGEAGLDYFYDNAPVDAQKIGLVRHIDAARETGLPLIIHARAADEDMMQILRDETAKNGAFPFVLHCFSSGKALAECGIELGGYVSFSGILTFKNSQEIRDIAKGLPMDKLLVETDAPYLAPPPHRGQRNEPAFVVNTAKVLAETLNVSFDSIAAQTTDNFYRLFSKVPRHDG
jgi:TatD DNase family protein